jgi:FdhE protein
MRDSWAQRVERARQLAAAGDGSAPLLAFYATLLTLQQELYEFLRSRREWLPSGSLDRDLEVVRTRAPALLRAVEMSGPDQLAVEARQLLASGDRSTDGLLIAYWRAPSDRQFFAKALLQPYAQCLADARIAPVGRQQTRAENKCPFCGGAPQVSILETAGDADAGGRLLLCATCLSTWPFRRVLCAHCGEEDERRLGYFQSPSFRHLRLDVCESCKHYVKTVDLTEFGLAVPIVDEVAGAPLDLWARERGYDKIELNLFGL